MGNVGIFFCVQCRYGDRSRNKVGFPGQRWWWKAKQLCAYGAWVEVLRRARVMELVRLKMGIGQILEVVQGQLITLYLKVWDSSQLNFTLISTLFKTIFKNISNFLSCEDRMWDQTSHPPSVGWSNQLILGWHLCRSTERYIFLHSYSEVQANPNTEKLNWNRS